MRLFQPLLFVLFLFSLHFCSCALVGIDFGSEFLKLAAVKPGTPFHIVVDEQSQRKIPAVVAFDGGERQFGNGATQFTMRRPKETFWFASRLLGRSYDSPEVAEFRQLGFPYELVEISDRSTVGFRLNDSLVLSCEELLAMSLEHAIKCAEADSQQAVKDGVLTVPSYWTAKQRQAMMDAAELAGLNVLALIDENSAAALQLAIDRKFDNSTEPGLFLFYNMGASATEVSVVSLTAVQSKTGRNKGKWVGQVEVLATAWDSSLGGQYFEAAITEFLLTDIEQQLKTKKLGSEIRSNPRLVAKVRAAAEKAKNVLSANQETPVFLPGLIHDQDFKILVTREKFYQLAETLLARVVAPMASALSEAGVSVDSLNSTFILGGGVRIPAVQAAIKQFIKREQLGLSLNGDEAMAMGAVFRAANLSTAFQVRPLGFTDISPFPVGVTVSELKTSKEEFSKRASLFKRNHQLGKRKTVAFSHDQDLRVALAHENPELLPAGVSAAIADYQITGISAAWNSTRFEPLLANQKPRVSITFLLDSNGIVEITKAEAALEEEVRVYLPKPKISEDSDKENKTVNENKNNQTESSNNSTASATEAEEGGDSGAAEASEDSSEASDEEKKEEIPTEKSDKGDKDSSILTDEKGDYRLKKRNVRIPLEVSRVLTPGVPAPLSSAQKKDSRGRLESLRRADELKREIAAAKNAVEAHIYSVRNKLNDGALDEISTSEQREIVHQALQEAEDWLYEQNDETLEPFDEKLKELRTLTDPVLLRLSELTARPQALSMAAEVLNATRFQLADFEKNRPWIKEEEKNRLSQLLNDTATWLSDKVALQNSSAPHEPLAFESQRVYEKLRPLVKLAQEMERIKKPVEKPKKKEKTAKEKKADKEKGKEKESSATSSAKDEEADEAKDEAPQDEKAENSQSSETENSGETEIPQENKETKEDQKEDL